LTWSPSFTPTFKKDYKNLSHQNQKRVDEAISEILGADDPKGLGRPKLGKWRGAFGYDIGRAVRVFYSVDLPEHRVILLRCGPHPIY
jgi:mRNA-degrading endonuclease RelE of RelBE toxin-antitoxin system